MRREANRKPSLNRLPIHRIYCSPFGRDWWNNCGIMKPQISQADVMQLQLLLIDCANWNTYLLDSRKSISSEMDSRRRKERRKASPRTYRIAGYFCGCSVSFGHCLVSVQANCSKEFVIPIFWNRLFKQICYYLLTIPSKLIVLDMAYFRMIKMT